MGWRQSEVRMAGPGGHSQAGPIVCGLGMRTRAARWTGGQGRRRLGSRSGFGELTPRLLANLVTRNTERDGIR